MSGVETTIGFGASVLGIASAGISVATTLVRFSVSYSGSVEKIEDLSSRVSLTATILTTVGNTIETHKIYFKEDNFKGVWGQVIDRCQKDYGNLGQALNKARGEVKDLASDRERKVRKMTPWRKLVWALGGEERMKDLQSSLEESKTQVLMMQSAASLIVLQILGRRRILTEDETNDLAELKQKMGLLYAYLQEAKLLADRPVTLSKRKAQRRLSSSELEGQVGKNVEDKVVVLEEDAGEESTHEKRPVEPELEVVDRNLEETNEAERVEDIARRGRSWPPSPPPLDHEKFEKEKNTPHDPSAIVEPFYEAWAIIDFKHSVRIKTFQLLGLKLKIKEHNLTGLDSYVGIAATQSELKDLIAQLRRRTLYSNPPSTLQQITAVSSRCARTATGIISIRNDATKYSYPPRTWAIAVLAPWSTLPSFTSAFKTITKSQDPGYLLILLSPGGGAGQLTIPTPDLNPFIGERKSKLGREMMRATQEDYELERPHLIIESRRSHYKERDARRNRGEKEESLDKLVRKKIHDVSPSSSTSSQLPSDSWTQTRQSASKTNRNVDEIEIINLSQKAEEIAVNDFLATFSSLYDDVPEEERTKVLDSTPVREQADESHSESESDSESEDYEGGHARRARSKGRTRGTPLADD